MTAERLAPLIQDVILIGYRQRGSLKIGDSTHHVAVLHIAAGIVVEAHDKNSRMLAMNGLHQNMEVQIILMILGQQHKPPSGAVSQMPRIADACQSHVRREHNPMSRFSQRADPACFDAVVVQIKIHGMDWESLGA